MYHTLFAMLFHVNCALNGDPFIIRMAQWCLTTVVQLYIHPLQLLNRLVAC